jgi:hypothetical protein
MLGWIRASAAFFLYVILAVPFVRGLPRRRRLLAAAGSIAGLVVAIAATAQTPTKALHDWILPPSLLLIAYWTSGLLFAAPMPGVERALEAFDRSLNVDRWAARMPSGLTELLELSYLGIYPLVPIALAIHLFATPSPDPERFWTVILVTDFVCFAFLPWIHTRPPRAFRTGDPWISSLRRLNLRLLGKTSIQVNTFPSGHAAEAVAATLLVADAPWPLIASVAVSAVLVSVGAVLGRYHYAADALLGWIVAVAVWSVIA